MGSGVPGVGFRRGPYSAFGRATPNALSSASFASPLRCQSEPLLCHQSERLPVFLVWQRLCKTRTFSGGPSAIVTIHSHRLAPIICRRELLISQSLAHPSPLASDDLSSAEVPA